MILWRQRESADTPWRRLLRSFATLTAGEGAARLLGLVAVVVMARKLGPGGFGVAVLGTTLVNWFRLIVDSGTEIMGVRDTSRTPDRFREVCEPILGLRLALSLAAATLFAVVAMAVPGTPSDRAALLLFALVLPAMGLNLRFMVLGLKAARAVAVGNVAAQGLMAFGVVLLLQDRHDLPLVPLLVAAAELLYAAVVLAAVARRWGVIRPRVDLGVWRRTVRAGLPLAVGMLAATARYSIGLLLIAAMLTRRDVGLFGAAYKPVLFFSTLVALLSVSFLSSFSSSAGGAERADLVRKTVRASALVTLPVAAVLSVGSAVLATLLYGSDYGGSVTPLAVLAWSLPPLALGQVYANILIWADRQGVLMRQNVVGTIANVAGTAAAIPLFGLVGAACAVVGTLVLVLALNYRSAVRLGLAEPLWPRARGGPATRPPPTSTRPGTTEPGSRTAAP